MSSNFSRYVEHRVSLRYAFVLSMHRYDRYDARIFGSNDNHSIEYPTGIPLHVPQEIIDTCGSKANKKYLCIDFNLTWLIFYRIYCLSNLRSIFSFHRGKFHRFLILNIEYLLLVPWIKILKKQSWLEFRWTMKFRYSIFPGKLSTRKVLYFQALVTQKRSMLWHFFFFTKKVYYKLNKKSLVLKLI